MIYYLLVSLALSLILSLLFLIPNLHINLILSVLLGFLSDPNIGSIVIVSLSIMYVFLSSIPTYLFYAPNEQTYLSYDYNYSSRGQGYFAIYLWCLGGIYGTLLLIPISLFYTSTLHFLDNIASYVVIPVLTIFILYLIASSKRILDLMIILFAAMVGFLTLQSSLEILNPIYVIISGLFGMSSIYIGLVNTNKTIRQNIEVYGVDYFKMFILSFLLLPTSIFISLFAGMGASTGSYITSKFMNLKDEYLIFANGLVSYLTMVLSFFSAYIINKSRTGSGFYLTSYIDNTLFENYIMIVVLIIFISIIAYLFTLRIAKSVLDIHPRPLLIISLIMLIFSVLVLTNYLGYLVFIICTLLGIICVRTKTSRAILISSIIVPVIFFYLTF